MTTALHWRVYITAGSGSQACCTSLELLGGGGNIAVPGNGTASAFRITSGYPAVNAFDESATTEWHDENGSNPPTWLRWSFDTPQDVAGFAWTTLATMTATIPAAMVLQSSDDAITWTARTGTVAPTFAVSTRSVFYIPGHADFALTAPAPTLSAFGGASAYLSAPTPTLLASSGAWGTLIAPSPRAQGVGHNSFGEQAAFLTAPSPTLDITTGANSSLTAPSPTLGITGTVWGFATAILTPTAPSLVATGTVSEMGQAALTGPSPNLIGYGGAVCSIALTNGPTLVASGTTGGVASAALTCPLYDLSASGTAQNYGSANLIAPSPQMGVSMQAYLVAPSATLTAIGTATVTATYEAYALNLNHSNPEANDEVTHYTNFPFTHIVRYKNSYYGANSTGLYLLEGTTDDGVPIGWSFKTGMSDFDSPQLKTVTYAYFGGRFGPAATVSIYPSEPTGISYSYTTPRGQYAQNYRQQFGKGLKARYFAIGASGTDVLELDSIDLTVATLTRRI